MEEIKHPTREVVWLKKPIRIFPNIDSDLLAVLQLDEEGKPTNKADIYYKCSFFVTRVIEEDNWEPLTDEEWKLAQIFVKDI